MAPGLLNGKLRKSTFLITKIPTLFATYFESDIYHFLRRKWDKGLPMRVAEAKRRLPDIDDNDDYTSDESVLPPLLLDAPAYQNMVYTGVEVRPSHEPRTSNREPQLRRVSWWRRRALMSFFGVVML